MKNVTATAAIRELCSLGLPGELLIPALLEALHRVIPSSRNLFDWVNAEGRIQRYYFEGPIDHKAARLYFDEFHNKREAEAMPKYVDVIRGGATIRSAAELDHRRFFDSALYNEIWRPQQLHYRLEAIVRGRDGKPLGSLVLYREERDRIFSKAEEQTLEALVPYVAHGLLHGKDRRVDYARSDRCSVRVNLDPGGRIVHLSRNAHKVLLLAHGDISPASAARDPTTESFPTLTLLHRQLARPGDLPEALCALTLTNNWGQFEFRADRMEPVGSADPAWTVVTIEHLVPREVQLLDVLEGYALSIAQKKVCALLMQRLSQPEIAERLGVSPHTVVDHVRKIYLKLDVHSVEELRSRLDADARR
jgi:DNA-binding CsgD family transcriptional regulator